MESEEDRTSCEEYASSMESGLKTAILEGQLAAALTVVNSDSPVSILTGNDGVDGAIREIPPPDEGVSRGAIAGIVAGGIVAVLMIAALLVRGNRGRQEYYSKQNGGDLEEIMPAQELEGTDSSNLNLVNSMSTKSFRASRNPSLKKSSMRSKNASRDMDNDGHEAYIKISGGKEDSSNAGSSGWSSHGGMSSIDTSSVDDELSSAFSGAEGGMNLAALGAASHASVFRARSAEVDEDDTDTDMDRPDDITMTYSELDRAISKGDWAAVGKLLRRGHCRFGLCALWSTSNCYFLSLLLFQIQAFPPRCSPRHNRTIPNRLCPTNHLPRHR